MIGHLIYFDLWAAEDKYAKPKRFSITTTEAPEFGCDFQINQNFTVALVTTFAATKQYELWHLHQPSMELILPNYDSFLTEEELELISLDRRSCNWLLDKNPNSEYLMVLYCSESVSQDVRFVLVFTGFTCSKYLHRIAMPANVSFYIDATIPNRSVDILIVGSGKDATTVLTVQTKDPYQFFVYDLSNGQMLLTIPLGRYHGRNCQYLFPTEVLTGEDDVLGGVNVIQIECKGEKWTASTNFASYPIVEGYEEMRLVQVTDTRTLWKVDKHDLIICDYLLNDFNFWLDN